MRIVAIACDIDVARLDVDTERRRTDYRRTKLAKEFHQSEILDHTFKIRPIGFHLNFANKEIEEKDSGRNEENECSEIRSRSQTAGAQARKDRYNEDIAD